MLNKPQKNKLTCLCPTQIYIIIIIIIIVFKIILVCYASLGIYSFYYLLPSTVEKKNLCTEHIHYWYNINIQIRFYQIIHPIVSKNALDSFS